MFTYVKSEIYIDISSITKKIMMNTQTSLSKKIKVITQSELIGFAIILTLVFKGRYMHVLPQKNISASASSIFKITLTI